MFKAVKRHNYELYFTLIKELISFNSNILYFTLERVLKVFIHSFKSVKSD